MHANLANSEALGPSQLPSVLNNAHHLMYGSYGVGMAYARLDAAAGLAAGSSTDSWVAPWPVLVLAVCGALSRRLGADPCTTRVTSPKGAKTNIFQFFSTFLGPGTLPKAFSKP